jgi:hypothetical protein
MTAALLFDMLICHLLIGGHKGVALCHLRIEVTLLAENQAIVEMEEEMKDFYQSLKLVSLFLSLSENENLGMKKTPVCLAFTRFYLLNFVEHLNHTSTMPNKLLKSNGKTC